MTTPMSAFMKEDVASDEDDDLVDLEASAGVDIDPNEWLSAPYEHAQGVHTFEDGRRLKITAITDEEEAKIRKSAKRPDPKNPRAMKVDALAYRRELIAHSVNKAYGRTASSPGAISGDHLKSRPIGELNNIVRSIMLISGVPDEVTDTSDLLG